ncbi:abortive infection family protein [Chryseobacterium taklimakanense]|uniref:abortive infection family protein n=1 Tax=Chryseobacterium taklimakanense TaxID=536441 RepID=UPI001EF518D3|nr:abortive infection family protein [Chryseobacterium taklimakanense]MCG7280847.1 abortive infection family protein [Chryseobacterium taklimakanense]
MADLTFEEKEYLEHYFDMSGGYVLDFYNSTFQRFIKEKTGVDIYITKYEKSGESKARRLREFFRIEPNHVVSKLINDLIKYRRQKVALNSFYLKSNPELEKECLKIVERLKEEGISKHVSNIDVVIPTSDFEKLTKSIRRSIDDNEPEVAIDRLHTYFMKYFRELLLANKIEFAETDTLNALFGKYVKFLESNSAFETEMCKTILKTSISLLEKYNGVRNNNSFAHPNPLLNYRDSLYIFDSLARLKGYIDEIQSEIELKNIEIEKQNSKNWEDDDLPF